MQTLSSSSLPVSRRDALKSLGLAGGALFGAAAFLRAEDAKPGGAPAGAAATVSLAGPQAGYYRFRIGEIEALALHDGGLAVPPDQSPFAVDEAPGAVKEGLDAALLPSERVQVPFTVLLVKLGNELVLIDAGAGSAYGPAAGLLTTNLGNAGIKPEQITAVVLTHAHGDHFGGLLLPENRAPRFPNAQIFVSRKEQEFWMQPEPNLGGMAVPPDAAKGFVSGAQGVFGALKDRFQPVTPGDKLFGGGIELLDTPGHTPGHVSLLIGSGKDRLLHFADAAHHHALTFAHPGWRFAFDTDAGLAVETRRKLFDRAAAERLRLFGSHMPLPGLGRVRKAGNAYDFVIEPFAVA